MCQSKPAARCANHTIGDWSKAQQKLAEAQTEFEALGEPNFVDAKLKAKREIFEKWDRALSVASVAAERNAKMHLYAHSIGETNLTPEEQSRHNLVVSRVDALRAEPAVWEQVRREAHLRKLLGQYETARRKAHTVVSASPIGGNARQVVDALTFLETMGPATGGRPLDPDEKSALALASSHAASAPDYLPDEGEVFDAALDRQTKAERAAKKVAKATEEASERAPRASVPAVPAAPDHETQPVVVKPVAPEAVKPRTPLAPRSGRLDGSRPVALPAPPKPFSLFRRR
jgi:hypothetical protein